MNRHLHEYAQMQTCVGVTLQVHMGQDLRAGFSLESAITDQFTPPHVSMLHLSLAESTWVEMRHGDGPCL